MLAEVLAGARPAPAARRRDREVRPRDVLLQRRPRGAECRGRDADPRAVAARRRRATTTSPRCRPAGCRARSRRRSGDGYALRGRQLRQPGHGRAHGRDSGGRQAVETADACLGDVVEAVERARRRCLVTADHGNAETMLEPDGVSPHTAHTTNPVPLVVTDEGATLRDGGELSDLAPTVLDLLGLAAAGGHDGAISSLTE